MKTLQARIATFRAGRSRFSASKGRFYRKSLIMLLLVSGIPGIVIGALVYEMAGGRLEAELLQIHHRQIEQRARNIDDQLTNLELMLSHWAFDSKFDYSLNNPNLVQDYAKIWDLTKTLVMMQGSNMLSKRVELYVAGDKPLLFDPEYSVLASSAMKDIYEGLLHKDKITFWYQGNLDPNRPSTQDLVLVHHIPGGSQEPFGTLVVRLDSQKVANLLRTMNPYNEGETFLLEEGGGLFASAGGSKLDSSLVSAVRKKIGMHGSAQGSFLLKWNEVTYAVTYGNISRIADVWTYASASPITKITSPVIQISKAIITVSLSALLLAALLAWLASRSIYSPVKKLLQVLQAGTGKTGLDGQDDEFKLIERQWLHLNSVSSDLNAKLSNQLPYVKESFLHQLLQGYLYAYSEQDLLQRMKQLKWEVERHRFMILHVRLTGIASLEARFKYGDEGLVTFAAVNMIEELAAAHFEQCHALNFHDLTAGLLLIEPLDRPNTGDIQAFCAELAEAVNQLLKMKVTIAVSRSTPRISDIPLAFEAAKQAAAYRNFENENQVIELESLTLGEEASSGVQYPFTLERELIQALRTGREPDTYELLAAFLEALSGKGAKEFDVQQGMLHLLGTVLHAMMISGIQPNRLFLGVNLYEQLSEIREPPLILAWFRERVIDPFLKELVGRSDAQVKRMIEQTMIYLQTYYMKDISLDNCADLAGTSPFFLSKSFKQVTGKNFIDYLTELRMDKAKELLRETELKINDVAEQVGYQQSYFNRIFKKLEGITPGRYRELSRAE